MPRSTMVLAGVLAGLLMLVAGAARADQTRIRVALVTADGVGATIGTIRIADTGSGLRLTPLLKGLAPGLHGMHIHENPSCAPGEANGQREAALAAGGHFDPDKTGRHEGPTGKGHLGDLPALVVGRDGIARQVVTAPRLKLADIKGHALIIHAGGDNYADQPAPLGGGGARIACAVIH